MPKKGIHPTMHRTKIIDINGFEFDVSTVSKDDIKVEVSCFSHPTYNPDKQVKQVAKGRMEQFMEKQKRIQAASKAS